MDTAIHAPRDRLPLFALLTANGVSVVGSQFTTLSVPWFVLQTTGSATKTGIIGFATALSFIAAFFGGGLGDRLGLKRVSVAADLSSGIAVACMPLLYHTVGLSFWQLVLLVLARAFCNTPGGTARLGLLPDLIGISGISTERANGVYQSTQYAAQVASTALLGILIALIGASNMLWLDGVSFLLSATIIFFAIPTLRHGTPAPIHRRPTDYRTELVEGVRWLLRDRLLSATTCIATLINLVGTGLVAVVLPVFAKSVYGTSVAFGLLFTGFSVGTLGGSILYTALGSRIPRRVTVVAGVMMLGVPLLLLEAQPPVIVSAIALAVVGFFNGPLNAVMAVIEQERIPAALRGRVIGAIIAMANVASPIGALLGGYIVGAAGVRATLLGIAIALVGVGVWTMCNRTLRGMDARVACG